MADPNQLLQQAVADHQAGRLEAAETGYRKILAAEPRHVDALQLLGVLVQQAGRAAEAVTLIEKAEALRNQLRTEALNSEGGSILLALDAAQNLNMPKVTLNSDDPAVPLVLDLGQLTQMLIGITGGSASQPE